MILVTGAAGKTGLAVVRALVRKGKVARALVHREHQVKVAREAGAHETIVGDIKDGHFLSQATRGVEAIYLICPNVHPMEFEVGQSVIAAAKQASVRYIVYHSVMYPQIQTMPHHWQKLLVEEALIQSELPFTILQPASYMQNILPYWEVIRETGEYIIPYSVDSMFSPVDLADVADVAAKVLTNSEHEGAIYQLAGPKSLNSTQMAEIIGRSLGREVKARSQILDDWRRSASERGMAGYAVDALAKMFDYYDQHGFAGSGVTLEKLLSRPAKRFAQFVSQLK